MNDQELLVAAIKAAGYGESSRRFAFEVLGIKERGIRYWLAGEREMHATARIVCRAIIANPDLADALVRAHELLIKGE